MKALLSRAARLLDPESHPARNRFSRKHRFAVSASRASPAGARQSTHVPRHPSCERLKPSKRSSRPHLRTIWRNDDPHRDESRQPEASEGNRGRGPYRPHQGLVVAVLPDRTQREGAFRREPLAYLTRPGWRPGDSRPRMAREWQSVSEILERSGERRERTLLGSSTIGRANGRSTRTRRSWTGRGRFGWSPPIALPGTSRLGRRRAQDRTRGRPASTGAPIQRT